MTPTHVRSLERTSLGRTGASPEVVAAALSLAPDEASFVSGQVLHVDGGRLCARRRMAAQTAGTAGTARATVKRERVVTRLGG